MKKAIKIAVKVLSRILVIILCAVLLINLWFIVERVVLHEQLPSIHGYSQAAVLSGSMEPSFSAGDLLLFRERSEYEVGQVVIFSQNGSLVTHRIVAESDGGFVTRGDANNTDDQQLLSRDSIKGELIKILPGVGSFMSFLRSPPGLLVLVIVGALLIVLPDLIEHKRKRVESDGCKQN